MSNEPRRQNGGAASRQKQGQVLQVRSRASDFVVFYAYTGPLNAQKLRRTQQKTPKTAKVARPDAHSGQK